MEEDMKHCTALLKLLLGFYVLFLTPAFAQIQSDQFNTGSLSSFWRYINPLGDATQDFTGTQARFTVPGILSHDAIQFGQNNSPRLVQEIATPGNDFGNLEVFAKFDATMNAAYQMVGVQVIQDASNYVRCELFSDGVDIYPLLWAFGNDGSPNPPNPVVGSPLPTGSNAPLFIRVRRVDTVFTLYWSTSPGGGWTQGATINHTMNADSVGVYCGNSDGTTPGTSAPAFTGLVDYFTTVDPAPVQLASFTATVANRNRVQLNWMTISETNNYGFYVQKSLNETSFERIAGSFQPGHGTTVQPHNYTFTDESEAGNWYYRLEQIDLDNTKHFSDPIHANVLTAVVSTKGLPIEFALQQNYPNPFNPTTQIRFDVPQESRVRLEVFSLIGQKVATVFDGIKSAGTHEVPFDATNMTSGVYVYTLTANNVTFTRKMVLMK
jgi:hypothetical protein